MISLNFWKKSNTQFLFGTFYQNLAKPVGNIGNIQSANGRKRRVAENTTQVTLLCFCSGITLQCFYIIIRNDRQKRNALLFVAKCAGGVTGVMQFCLVPETMGTCPSTFIILLFLPGVNAMLSVQNRFHNLYSPGLVTIRLPSSCVFRDDCNALRVQNH